MCILLVAFAFPALAADYKLGVSVGQYVTYGNFNFSGNLTPPYVLSWSKTEVVAVSGKEVTLRSSGQLENGTAEQASFITFNVETGTVNGISNGYGPPPIIAADLNEGDLIPSNDIVLRINKTETQKYLGAKRSVNILNITRDLIIDMWGDWPGSNVFIAGSISRWNVTYDKASGIRLEQEMEFTHYSNYTK